MRNLSVGVVRERFAKFVTSGNALASNGAANATSAVYRNLRTRARYCGMKYGKLIESTAVAIEPRLMPCSAM